MTELIRGLAIVGSTESDSPGRTGQKVESILAAGAAALVFGGERTVAMRGPTGIVGLIVTVLVIYLILRLLGVL